MGSYLLRWAGLLMRAIIIIVLALAVFSYADHVKKLESQNVALKDSLDQAQASATDAKR